MKKIWSLEQNEETPFDALKTYDKLMGEKIAENNTFKVLTFVMSAINLILVIGIIFISSQSKFEPVFISENSIGELSYLGSVKSNTTKITNDMITATVQNFIINLYTLPQDAEVLKSNLKKCYAHTTSNASNKLSKLLKEDSPFERFGYENQIVTIESVLLLSDNTYQIDFFIKNTQINGINEKTFRKRAVLTTVLLEPTKEDILNNPGGIYIKNFDVTTIGAK